MIGHARRNTPRPPRGPSAPPLAHALERRTLLSGVTFAAQAVYPVGFEPLAPVVADLGNGEPDVIVPGFISGGSTTTGKITVLVGNGHGTFSDGETYTTVGGDPSALKVADLGNGHPDLVFVDGGVIGVMLGNGSGTFAAEQTYPVGTDPMDVELADLGNGHPDLVVCNYADDTVSVLLGNGDGTFAAQRTYAVGFSPQQATVADLGNGQPDLVVCDGDATVDVLLGNGDGTFQSAQTYAVASTPDQPTVADLGNGHPDVIVGDAGGNVDVLLGNGDGTLSPEQTYAIAGTSGYPGITVTDLGNGHLDVVASNQSDDVAVLLGNGDGTFQPQQAYAVGANPVVPAVADLGNGHPDIVVADAESATVSVLLGNGDGTFAAQQTYPVGTTPVTVTVTDLGNGLPDVVVSNQDDDSISVLLNTSVVTPHLAFAAGPAAVATGTPFALITVDVAGYGGTPVAGNTSAVTLTISAGGTLLGTTTVAAVDGVATFAGLSVPAAGTYTLTATDAGDTSATSAAFDVVTPALAFAAGPAGATADEPLAAVTVVVTDPITGAVLAGDASDVTLSIGGGGTLLGTTTVAAVGGVATFADVRVGTAGTYTLTATDAAAAAAVSAAFVVAPDALAFAARPGVVAAVGATLGPVTVDVTDPATGALLATDTSAVTLALTGGAGTLLGVTTAAAVGGVATFAGLSVSAAGTYRLSATDPATAAATTAAFTVVNPAATATAVGGLDPAYGLGGIAAHDLGFTATTGVAADGAGSVVVGPVGPAGAESFGVARLTADGAVDATFGTAGVTVTALPGFDAVPSAVAVLPDGDVLVAGTATAAAGGGAVGSRFAVAEYTAAGSLDPAFGTGGVVTVGFGSGLTDDVLRAMAVGADGTIYLGGRSDAAGRGNADLAVAVLTAAGAAVGSFGRGGTVLLDVAGGDDGVNGLAVQADGKVVAAGSATAAGGTVEVVVARLDADGTPDRQFGTGGLVTSSPGGLYDEATSVAVRPNGQVVVGGLSGSGSAADPSARFLVQQYTAQGRTDRSFGDHGSTFTAFGSQAGVTRLAVQADGSIVAAGPTAASAGGVQDVAVARYTADGRLDPTFDGGTGRTVVDLGGGGEGLTAATPALARPALRAMVVRPADVAASTGLAAAFAAFTAASQGTVALTAGGAILTAGQAGTQTVVAELVAAGLDLAATLAGASPAAARAGARGAVTVTITEVGTARAVGVVTVTVSFAADAAGSGPAFARTLSKRVNLRAAQGRAYRVAVADPSAAGAWYTVATVVGSGPLAADLDPTNNTAVSGTAVTVS